MRRLGLVAVLAGCGRVGFAIHDDASRDDGLSPRPDILPIDVVPLDSSLPSGLIAWYPMDDTASNMADVVGGVNGTCAGSQCPSSIPGYHGNAFLFDATDDCIQVPDLGQLDLQAYTIAIRIRQDAQDNCSAVAKRVDVGGNQLDSWQMETNTAQQAQLTMNNGSPSNSAVLSATNAIAYGPWIHMAVTVGGGMRNFYVGGAAVASGAWTVTAYDTHPMLIGCDDNGGVAFALHWDGGLDDLQIYNRALSPAEIMTIALQ